MSGDVSEQPPLLQRLYDRIWLIAILALLFWVLSYVLWGYVDIYTVPPGVIG